MRTMIMSAMAALALLLSTATAAAIEIRPSGRLLSLSNGNLTFRANEGSFTCAVSLTGTLASRTVGTIGRREPGANPRIGNYTAGAARECSGGAMTLSFPERSWQMYIERWEGSRARIYALQAQFLISTVFARCLYEALIALSYEEGTGVATITEMTVLRQVALMVCPIAPSLAGALRSTAEGSIFGYGPQLTPSTSELNYERRRQSLAVTLRNDWATQLRMEELNWAPIEDEGTWTRGTLDCGTVASRGSCSATIESTGTSRRITVTMMEELAGGGRQIGKYILNP